MFLGLVCSGCTSNITDQHFYGEWVAANDDEELVFLNFTSDTLYWFNNETEESMTFLYDVRNDSLLLNMIVFGKKEQVDFYLIDKVSPKEIVLERNDGKIVLSKDGKTVLTNGLISQPSLND